MMIPLNVPTINGCNPGFQAAISEFRRHPQGCRAAARPCGSANSRLRVGASEAHGVRAVGMGQAPGRVEGDEVDPFDVSQDLAAGRESKAVERFLAAF